MITWVLSYFYFSRGATTKKQKKPPPSNPCNFKIYSHPHIAFSQHLHLILSPPGNLWPRRTPQKNLKIIEVTLKTKHYNSSYSVVCAHEKSTIFLLLQKKKLLFSVYIFCKNLLQRGSKLILCKDDYFLYSTSIP